jgi:hypothetical protein
MATSSFPNHSPYAEPALNRIYNMLFCDDPRVFAPQPGREPAPWQSVLFARHVNADAVLALANDKQQDARVRCMAFNWLRQQGHQVPTRELLGAVMEVPLEGGLDVLAVYIDGSVRYLNHRAAPTMVEGPMPLLLQNVSRVLQASQHIVNQIGPSDQERQPAPASNVRLNFLVSDGLYFGEGPMNVLSNDAMAGPLLQAGGQLLGQLVDMARAAA